MSARRAPDPVRVRRAAPADVPSIARIYNEAIRHTTATFDTEPRSLRERRRWFAAHDRRHPILVAERDGAVVGWASLSPWSDRPAYDRTAEVSVYVAAADRGQGIGSRLLGALVRRGRSVGHHTRIARIADRNPASLRLHATAGFRSIGVMREVGSKFGRLLDVDLLQLLYPQARRPGPAGRRRRRRPGRD